MVKPTLDPFRWAMVKLRRGRISAPCLLDRVPRVSVVITCYNCGHYLRQCVDSVTRNQPGIKVEVIIVDDKTTDDSVAVVRSIKDRDERVRLILHEQNKGHIATYNDGLDAATGEFVPFLSADDLATPGALTRATELLVADPSVGAVYGNAIHFSGGGHGLRQLRNRLKWFGVKGDLPTCAQHAH
ncbi:glycosyltransferase family 2 protein (plasmid) [Sinorhizobium meliloti]|uniref:glycosyltransferase family 2 protein n=1 Tax=Rhizobium meliloti TaxID=382 RepID=UPI00299DE370